MVRKEQDAKISEKHLQWQLCQCCSWSAGGKLMRSIQMASKAEGLSGHCANEDVYESRAMDEMCSIGITLMTLYVPKQAIVCR